MCLSTVYRERDGQLEQLARNVSSVEVQPERGTVTLFDILGTPTEVEGAVRRIDLANATIVLGAA